MQRNWKKSIENKYILSFNLIFVCQNRFYSFSHVFCILKRSLSHQSVNTLFCNSTFFGVVLFVFTPVELWAAAKKGGFSLDCVLLFLPQPLRWWYSRAAGCPFWWQSARKLFFFPVSFQLDQFTDLATSDAVGSLDLTWGKWWVYSTTG